MRKSVKSKKWIRVKNEWQKFKDTIHAFSQSRKDVRKSLNKSDEKFAKAVAKRLRKQAVNQELLSRMS